jgi:hypothetical protein
MNKALTLFTEKVQPKLAPLFAEWEHCWRPRPMDTAERAAAPAYMAAE